MTTYDFTLDSPNPQQFNIGIDFGNGGLKAYATNGTKTFKATIPNAFSLDEPQGKNHFQISFGKTLDRFNKPLWFGQDVLSVPHMREIADAKYQVPAYLETLSSAVIARLIKSDSDFVVNGVHTIHAKIATAMPVGDYFNSNALKAAKEAYSKAFQSKSSNWFIKRDNKPTLRIIPEYVGLYPESLVCWQQTSFRTRYQILLDIGYGTTDYLITHLI